MIRGQCVSRRWNIIWTFKWEFFSQSCSRFLNLTLANFCMILGYFGIGLRILQCLSTLFFHCSSLFFKLLLLLLILFRPFVFFRAGYHSCPTSSSNVVQLVVVIVAPRRRRRQNVWRTRGRVPEGKKGKSAGHSFGSEPSPPRQKSFFPSVRIGRNAECA